MMDRARALRPLDDAAPAVDRLDTYESPAELAEALRATWLAVDTALRVLLRSDGGAPDEVRLKAMSRSELKHDALITELRRRNLISLRLAGGIHELMQRAADADPETVRPSDADTAGDVVRKLRDEIQSAESAPTVSAGEAPGGLDAAAPAAGGRRRSPASTPLLPVSDPAGDHEDWPTAGGASGRPSLRRLARGPVVLVVATGLLLAAAIAMVFLFGRGSSDMAEGVEAFRAGRMGVAEQHFRAALQRDDDNVTARLYLGRILRAQGRQQEAAELLRRTAELAPRDAAVRRELGYLFLDLQRPQQAAEQFRQAVELDPDEPMGWVGLYEAMVRSDDPLAAELLQRAPASAQAMIRTGRP